MNTAQDVVLQEYRVREGGDDRCKKGHIYPSSSSTKALFNSPIIPGPPIAPEELEKATREKMDQWFGPEKEVEMQEYNYPLSDTEFLNVYHQLKDTWGNNVSINICFKSYSTKFTVIKRCLEKSDD